MYDAGYSNVEIAKVLLLSHEAIRKHIVDIYTYSNIKKFFIKILLSLIYLWYILNFIFNLIR
ncbi:MAG: hypothetical protein LN588_02540 [Rickettsia endosymbiont of Bryobia graminum]|nr:hypothetical protein [Rickettsia endosymbiont of Bryobia graminum]